MSRTDDFVDYIFERIGYDKGFRAELRRADGSISEWKVWPLIQRFFGRVDNELERKTYVLIASAIAKSGQAKNGSVGLGTAMRLVSKEEKNEFPIRFQRILSSDNLDDLLRVMRSTLQFISSKGICMDYKSLLKQLLEYKFENSRERIRYAWASDYLNVTATSEGV